MERRINMSKCYHLILIWTQSFHITSYVIRDNSNNRNSLPEELYRCHGLPCSEWDEVEQIMGQISEQQGIPVDLDDIWLTLDQAKQLLLQTKEAKLNEDSKTNIRRRFKRNVFDLRRDRMWDLPIIYKFDGSHTEGEKDTIRKAFQQWESHTCLVFFEFNRGIKLKRHHLILTNSKGRASCNSFVGMISSFQQLVNLGSDCLKRLGTPLHEIGHSLGLWHEHQRPDRDSYVDILFENLPPNAEFNFYILQKDLSISEQYDFNSVMHYGPKYASQGEEITIATRDPLYQHNIGQRVELSFLDAKMINQAYCSKECKATDLGSSCQHGGYQDPNHCGRCKCPDGLGGSYCQTVASSPDQCGGTYYIFEGESVTIYSPGYTSRKPYTHNTACSWIIKGPQGYNIHLKFEGDFSLYYEDHTCLHWVEVGLNQTDFGTPGPRFCGPVPPTSVVRSVDNEMLVTFRSKEEYVSNRKPHLRKGFKATAFIPTQHATTYSWSEWGACVGHQCGCGGCSARKRSRMCEDKQCQGTEAEEQRELCAQPCNANDTMLYYVAKFYTTPCPSPCCDNYQLEDGECVATPINKTSPSGSGLIYEYEYISLTDATTEYPATVT